jgi:hypothetical protein
MYRSGTDMYDWQFYAHNLKWRSLPFALLPEPIRRPCLFVFVIRLLEFLIPHNVTPTSAGTLQLSSFNEANRGSSTLGSSLGSLTTNLLVFLLVQLQKHLPQYFISLLSTLSQSSLLSLLSLFSLSIRLQRSTVRTDS